MGTGLSDNTSIGSECGSVLLEYNTIDESQSTKKIKRGAFASYLGILVNIVAGLLYTPWMVHQIGSDKFGLYTLAISLISLFMLDLGLGESVSRFVTRYHSQGLREKVNNLLGLFYKLYLLLDAILLLVAVIIYLNLDTIYRELASGQIHDLQTVFLIAACFSVFAFPFSTFNGILISFECFFELKMCDLVQRILSVALIVTALIQGYGLYALVAANAISGLVIIAIKYILIKKKTFIKANMSYYSPQMAKDIFAFSIWSAIVSIAQRFIFNITPSILGAFVGAVSISIFGIASALESYIYTLASALNGFFLPKVTRLVLKDDSSVGVTELMIKVGRIQLSIIGLVSLGFILIGKDFIILWMGRDFTFSYYCAVLLILPSLIYLPQQIGNTVIVAKNKVKLQAYVFCIMAVLNIVLSIVFSQVWGAIGASFAICVAYLIRSLGLNVVYYKSLSLDIFRYFHDCYLSFIMTFLITITVGILSNFGLADITWTNLILKGIIIVVAYVASLWIITLNKYEKTIILELFIKPSNSL